jgi:hypothetical protein
MCGTLLQMFLVFIAREFVAFSVMILKIQRQKPRKMVQQFRSGMILGKCRIRVTI